MAASFLLYPTSSTQSYFPKLKTHLSAHSYKPVKITMSGEDQTLRARIRSEVDNYIKRTLSSQQSGDSIINAIDRLAFEVPRSMAPALCIVACEAIGGQRDEAIPTASALHLMHAAQYSDEPAMIKYGYQILDSVDQARDHRALLVRVEIEHAMELKGVIDDKEGGKLSSCGAACGAILGGGSEEEIEKLRRYGLYVGMIHNIMVKEELRKEKSMLKLADELRFLAMKELEGMKEKNIDTLQSILEEVLEFLKAQKYQLPRQVLISRNPCLMPIGPHQLSLLSIVR